LLSEFYVESCAGGLAPTHHIILMAFGKESVKKGGISFNTIKTILNIQIVFKLAF